MVYCADFQHPNYDDLVQALTDGASGKVLLASLPGGSGGGTISWMEAPFFGTGDVPGLTPDAAGYVITRIELEILQLGLVSPGSNPNNNGVWTDYSYNVILRVFGRAAP